MNDHDDEVAGQLVPFEREGARLIRRQWHNGQWYFSIVDVVRVLTDSDAPAKYWTAMKARIQDEGFRELSTLCRQLKMRALDGKLRATDAANVETMLRIIQSIPSPKAEPVRQWLAKVGAERLEDVAVSLDEAARRILMRGEVAEKNKTLASTAKGAGVLTSRDFAVFQDHGYMGLYGGETSAMIAERKGLAAGEHILDWMSSEELAANWFRITQAEAKLRREGVDNKGAANTVHYTVGQEVRETIQRLGGTMPEDLPTPAHSIRDLEVLEQKRIEAERQPSLFDEPEQ